METRNLSSSNEVLKFELSFSLSNLLTERLVDVDSRGVGERPDLRVGHSGFEERRDGEAGPGKELIFLVDVRW